MCEALLLKVEDAARLLSLGRSFTYSLISKGELPSVKIGGARRVALADVERFIERLQRMTAEEES